MKKMPVTNDESNFHIHSNEGVNPEELEINPILDDDAPIPDRIEAFAKLKYTREQIAIALGPNKLKQKDLLQNLHDETTEEYRAYQKGSVMGDAEVDIALSIEAQKGDNFSAAELLNRQNQRRISDARKELFNL